VIMPSEIAVAGFFFYKKNAGRQRRLSAFLVSASPVGC